MNKHRTIIFFSVCFIAPFLSALLFLGSGWNPNQTINKGMLLTQDVKIEHWQETDRKLWSIAIIAPNECSTQCSQYLHAAKQVHLALGKKSENVDVVLLSEGDVAIESASVVKTPLTNLHEGSVYLIDHMGLVVLQYPLNGQAHQEVIFKGLYTDIKKLLNYARSS